MYTKMFKVVVISIFLLFSLSFVCSVFAKGGGKGRGYSRSSKSSAVRVKAHTTKSGKYVPSHRRTSRDNTKGNNWSTKGNMNPDTGKAGTKEF